MWNNLLVIGKDAFNRWLDSLQASGRYTFTKDIAQREGPPAERKAPWRSQRDGRLVQLRSGFFVIVPAEYRSAGAPPPSWFIDDLMAYEKLPYYVGLLSAASLYGAAPQVVQEFQVVVPVACRPIVAGRLRIRFVMRSDLVSAGTRAHETPTGTMRVSTIEQTALDLVQYPDASGGWDNVAAVLGELAQQISASALKKLARAHKHVSDLQRLGYLLELAHADKAARALVPEVAERARYRPLEGRLTTANAERNERWHLLLNRKIQID